MYVIVLNILKCPILKRKKKFDISLNCNFTNFYYTSVVKRSTAFQNDKFLIFNVTRCLTMACLDILITQYLGEYTTVVSLRNIL